MQLALISRVGCVGTKEIAEAITEWEAQKWQPIETAPRDGTIVFVRGYHEFYGEYFYVALFSKSREVFETQNGEFIGHNFLTHWMRVTSPESEAV